MRRGFAIPCIFLVCAAGFAGVVDRIAVSVGNSAIRESQVESEVRVTALLNGAALDLSAAGKRQAASRLVDQAIIRAEMAKQVYPAPAEAEMNATLDKIKQARFRNNSEYERALKTYGVTEPELKAHLAWQLQVLHFIDLRFAAADALPSRDREGAVAVAAQEQRANIAFFAWLDGMRQRSRIQFHDEAFQ